MTQSPEERLYNEASKVIDDLDDRMADFYCARLTVIRHRLFDWQVVSFDQRGQWHDLGFKHWWFRWQARRSKRDLSSLLTGQAQD